MMVRKFVRALILIPLAIVLIAFAVANRQTVMVSLDPFDRAEPALSVALPLYVLILALIMVGVIVGGVAAWLRQHKWRSRARRAELQARELKAENDRLKRRDLAALPMAPSTAPLSVDRAPLSIPPPPR